MIDVQILNASGTNVSLAFDGVVGVVPPGVSEYWVTGTVGSVSVVCWDKVAIQCGTNEMPVLVDAINHGHDFFFGADYGLGLAFMLGFLHIFKKFGSIAIRSDG